MTAVIKTGGKQYSVNKDDILIVEKLPDDEGKKITFNDVLMLTEGDKTLIGTPYVENAIVTAEILEQSRAKKIIVFKKKRRQNYRRTKGHRQLQTKIKIVDISTSKTKVSGAEKKEVKKAIAKEDKIKVSAAKAEDKKVTKAKKASANEAKNTKTKAEDKKITKAKKTIAKKDSKPSKEKAKK
tara:strand:- start:6205 stop:6753 length:549 start_codon:yes stop_codon:yes gene_type:complete